MVAQVPLSTAEELKAAVYAAKRAFTSWRNTPVTTRQRIMFKLQELIRRDIVNFWYSYLFTALLLELESTGDVIFVSRISLPAA